MKRLSVGIDIAMEKFDVCLKREDFLGHYAIKGSRIFPNTQEGFKELIFWTNKWIKPGDEVSFVMEATGVYYENLTYYLHDEGFVVYVELANKVKNYFKSLNIKTKTDKVDASILADMGFERRLKKWVPMSHYYRDLRDITRLIASYQKDLNRAKSQLHAMNYAHNKNLLVLKMQQEHVSHCEELIEKLKEERRLLAGKDRELYDKIEKITTIKGVGFDTAVSIVCETNGFILFNNVRQVVSYAGLDVSHNQSGNHIGKSHISKKGNSHIRAVLYMPALSAIRYNAPIKALHERIKERNPNAKQKGVVAAMRKLLILIYTLWKKNEVYDKNYSWG